MIIRSFINSIILIDRNLPRVLLKSEGDTSKIHYIQIILVEASPIISRSGQWNLMKKKEKKLNFFINENY